MSGCLFIKHKMGKKLNDYDAAAGLIAGIIFVPGSVVSYGNVTPEARIAMGAAAGGIFLGLDEPAGNFRIKSHTEISPERMKALDLTSVDLQQYNAQIEQVARVHKTLLEQVEEAKKIIEAGRGANEKDRERLNTLAADVGFKDAAEMLSVFRLDKLPVDILKRFAIKQDLPEGAIRTYLALAFDVVSLRR